VLANGQCTAARRAPFLAAGGYAAAASHMTDDVALARALVADGRRVAFRDASPLLDVDMHASAAEVWRDWGRSIALADVTPKPLLAADVATVWLTMALPLLRRRRRDLPLLALRWAMAAAMRDSYAVRGPAYWLSPLADPATAVRLTWSALRPPRTWRGRVYGAGGRAPR
jgi:dolichol-phosphate mannosyltransferase